MSSYDDEATTFLPTFLVFAGYSYYPAGGVTDFQSAHADFEDAVAAARALTDASGNVSDPQDWAHVAELTDKGLDIVQRFGRA